MKHGEALKLAKSGLGVKLPEHKNFRYLDKVGLWVDKKGSASTPSLTKEDVKRDDWQVRVALYGVCDRLGFSYLFQNKPKHSDTYKVWCDTGAMSCMLLPVKNLFSKNKPTQFYLTEA